MIFNDRHLRYSKLDLVSKSADFDVMRCFPLLRIFVAKGRADTSLKRNFKYRRSGGLDAV